MALKRDSASGLDDGGCLSGCHFLTRFLYAVRISCGEVSLGMLRILWYSSGGFPIGGDGKEDGVAPAARRRGKEQREPSWEGGEKRVWRGWLVASGGRG